MSILLFTYENLGHKSLLDAGWQKLHNDTPHYNDVLYLNFQKKVELFDL